MSFLKIIVIITYFDVKIKFLLCLLTKKNNIFGKIKCLLYSLSNSQALTSLKRVFLGKSIQSI